MSDNEKQIQIKFEFPQVVNAALIPLATSIGTTMTHLWDAMTIGIETWYGKKKIEHDINLELFKKDISSKLHTIPEDNIQNPQMNIVGPAMDASKYYFEEDWYREMFSNLIAGACDDRKNDKIHPYFVEAIKQMTSNDAYVLASFKNELAQGIAEYRAIVNKVQNAPIVTNVFYTGTRSELPNTNSASIENLVRLGLLSLEKNRRLSNNEKYDCYEKDTYLAKLEKANKDPNLSFVKEYFTVALTTLGKSFIDICL